MRGDLKPTSLLVPTAEKHPIVLDFRVAAERGVFGVVSYQRVHVGQGRLGRSPT
jgi:hypothetical protein